MKKIIIISLLIMAFGCTFPNLPKKSQPYLIHIKWLGQTGFLIESNKTRLYINPYTSPIGSLKGDAIFISYSSPDLCNPSIIKELSKDSTIIITPPECATRLSNKNILNLIIDNEYHINEFIIKTIPTDKINNAGFLIKAFNKTIYYAGVTKTIPSIIKKVDVLILPIAGGDLSMNSTKALNIMKEINASYYIPMYYERESGINYDNGEKLKSIAKKQGINITLLNNNDLFIRQ